MTTDKTSKESSLYLPIKQIYFDQIIAGTKKEEYREIKDTTFKKYLDNEKGDLYINSELIQEDNPLLGDPMIYNGGKYPYFSIGYMYLDLAVGYEKERDTATVEVVDITFEIMKAKEGKDVIFDLDEEGKFTLNETGPYAAWMIVYHLGEVTEVHRKGSAK